MTCADFRDLPPDINLNLRDLHDCERHLQFCQDCRKWFRSAPDTPPYRIVKIRWQEFLVWINKGRPIRLYEE